MNLVLWIAQWALACFFAFFALFRIVDSVVLDRAPAVWSDRPLFTRGQSFGIGVLFLVGGFGLVSPVAGLHQNWPIPAAAVLLVGVLIVLSLRFGYGDELNWVLGFALLALAVLRTWPFPVAT